VALNDGGGGEWGDMTGQRPTGDYYENLGRKHYFGEGLYFLVWGIFSGFGSLVLEIG
jgi:hypothetical protein